MYKISFYAPKDHTEKVKIAMFKAGAGRIGNYDCCSWQVLGEGPFRPLKGSNPFIGSQDKIELVSEYRVEMVCDDANLKASIAAMKDAHPYEEVAYDVVSMVAV